MGRGRGGGHSVIMFAITGEMRMGPSNGKRKQTGDHDNTKVCTNRF